MKEKERIFVQRFEHVWKRLFYGFTQVFLLMIALNLFSFFSRRWKKIKQKTILWHRVSRQEIMKLHSESFKGGYRIVLANLHTRVNISIFMRYLIFEKRGGSQSIDWLWMIAPIMIKTIAKTGKNCQNVSSTATLSGFASAYATLNILSKNGVSSHIAPPIIQTTMNIKIIVMPPRMVLKHPRENAYLIYTEQYSRENKESNGEILVYFLNRFIFV